MAQRALSRKKAGSKCMPYLKASDDEKVKRNWNKACGLFERKEYSVAIIRCATCVELAINFAIRQELVVERGLPLPFVDKLLKTANGVRNKYQNLLLPITMEEADHAELRALWNKINNINLERNNVVHSGEFRSKMKAERVMSETYASLTGLMDRYDHQGTLKPFTPAMDRD